MVLSPSLFSSPSPSSSFLFPSNIKKLILYNYLQYFKMIADQPVVLNQQLPPKYESYSSHAAKAVDTLDQPIIDTVRRDFMQIYNKITTTMSGNGDYQKIRQQWDLWGPLIISLITASMGAFGTNGQMDEAFTNLFIGMWLGPLIITINASLLGAEVAILQTLCLIIYCSTPIMILSVAVFLMNQIIGSFFLNLLLAAGALVFVLKTNKDFFKSFIVADRYLLTLYPVLLFYSFMCIFIAMT